MPDPFHFELVSPERLMFSGEVEAVIVPGTEGQFTVLKDHAPLMTRLKPGIVEVDETATQKQRLFVRGGFAEINATGVAVLAERATPVEELTPEKLDHEILEAGMVRDGSSDFAAREAANALIAQLEEAKAALKF